MKSPDHPAITLHFLNAVLGGNPLTTEVQFLTPIIGMNFHSVCIHRSVLAFWMASFFGKPLRFITMFSYAQPQAPR